MSQIYRLYAPGDLRLESFELPPLGATDVHLRSRLGAISTGTESAWYFGTDPQLDPNYRPVRYDHPTFPKFLGYEKVAEIVAIGSDVKGYEAGQRVIANYGHADEYIWPAAKIAPIPDGITDEEAVFSTLMNVASHGVRRSGIRIGDTVMITGLGVVGMATLISANLAGAGKIIVTDWNDQRLELAHQYGADIIFNSKDGAVAQTIIDQFGKGCVDLLFECSASYEALVDGMAVTKRNGKVVVMAQLKGNYPSHPVFGVDFHLGELEMISSDGGWDIGRFATWYFRAIQNGMIKDIDKLISHRVSFADLNEGFRLIEQEPKQVLKVIVNYA